jgi:hypothetical protein
VTIGYSPRFTYQLDHFDAWVHDHEAGWGGHRFLARLAALWRAALRQDDAALGVDAAFTRPGVFCMLGVFKAKVEGIQQLAGHGDEEIAFDFV